MQASRLDTICAALPLFPLPRLVLMPRDLLPLHVFEPRYRALVAHVLANDRVMAVATLKPGYEAHYHEAPPIWETVGIGLVVSHQALPDGRSNLVLQAVGRARIEEELRTPHPFRVARSTLLRDIEDAPALAELRALVLQLGSYTPTAAQEATRIASLPGSEMVDELARRALEDPDQRLAYLRLDRVSERARMLEEHLAGLVTRGRDPIGEA